MDTVVSLRYYPAVSLKKRVNAKEIQQLTAEMLQHVDHLYRVAFHLAKDRDRANDCVQETYLRALNSAEQFKSGTNMKAWLTKILHNFFIDSYNRFKRIVPIDNSSEEPEAGLIYWQGLGSTEAQPETQMLQSELSGKISEALQKLPVEFSAPIVLVDMSVFSYAEAADLLSCPVGTVRSRLSRGRRLLHKQLREYVGGK
jgi:RNA polymerase sigma-70 factor (ECF subfamily)